MNPAAQGRLGTAVHIQSNLALYFSRCDALDLQGFQFCFGTFPLGPLIGLGKDGLGFEFALCSHCVRFRLQGALACLGCGVPFALDVAFGECRHRVPL